MKIEGSNLTKRETEIITELARGLYYKEIAGKIYISQETVKKHLKRIYRKLGVRNRIEATLKFYEATMDQSAFVFADDGDE